MDAKKEAEKYFRKYFKGQYINAADTEFKSLVRLLNKALNTPDEDEDEDDSVKWEYYVGKHGGDPTT